MRSSSVTLGSQFFPGANYPRHRSQHDSRGVARPRAPPEYALAGHLRRFSTSTVALGPKGTLVSPNRCTLLLPDKIGSNSDNGRVQVAPRTAKSGMHRARSASSLPLMVLHYNTGETKVRN
ncbi:Hypothetical predicted protein [Cloeon dipterum]|uniref:Uncharacterized protein n=1 Tax=Cloeon dipterum TaxID=197152 RepID=A0A8S1BYM5_9INSE|nr:Hypothetical predicted protein [Cloeon dipterum]